MVLRVSQDDELEPIDRGIVMLEELRREGEWVMSELNMVDLVVMTELADEGRVPASFLDDGDD